MLDAKLDRRFCALDGLDADMAIDPSCEEDVYAFGVVKGTSCR